MLVCRGQGNLPIVDKSPMDISYCPPDYPLLKIQDKAKEPLIARVIYSRPQKNEREIFGDLIEFGKLWRIGANEATEIEFYQNIKIKDSKIKKGRYTLYAIPNEDKWTIIINSETDIWGSFRYDLKKDVARMDLPVQKQDDACESFTMYFEKSPIGYNLHCYWDKVKITVPISL